MAINFYSIGAAKEVTGSKHVIEVDGASYILEIGVITMQGTGAALLNDDGIRKAYLGERGEEIRKIKKPWDLLIAGVFYAS
jgi:hypothetical protein